jgi:hypothetical protein
MRSRPIRPRVVSRPKERSPQLSLRKKLLFALVAVSSCLLLLELTARLIEVWVPPSPVDYGQGFDMGSRLFAPSTHSPGLMETRNEKLASFRLQEFASPKPVGTLRIVALGGSSVNYMDDEFRVLEGRLKEALSPRFRRVEILNCGGLSYGSHRLARLTVEILEYEPDVVFFYEAHNEFEELEQLQTDPVRFIGPQKVLSQFAIVRFIRDRVTAVRVARLRREHESRMDEKEKKLDRSLPKSDRTWYHEFKPQEVAARMEAFRTNMTRIVRFCESKRVSIILATAPSNLVKPYLIKSTADRYREVQDLIKSGEFARASLLGRRILKEAPGRHQSSDLENDIIRSIARERAIPLADVETAVIQAEPHQLPGETLFEDHCHLNGTGRKILRASMEAQILKVLASKTFAESVLPAG